MLRMNTTTARRNISTLMMEQLEGRLVLANFAWTAEEVYMLELVNRARANPIAEAARVGVDLTAGLTDTELARLVPWEPLALNEKLTLAARGMSADMAERGFFDHVNPDGLDPTDRAKAQGYSYSAGENIAAGYTSIDAAHVAWLESLGHRKNVLSLHENFDENFKYTEFGFGVFIPLKGSDAPYISYHSQEFGYQGLNPVVYTLGVVYDDRDANNFYSMGEGMADVRVEVRRRLAGEPVVGSYTTDIAGNFQIVVEPGEYDLVFVDQATGLTKRQTFTVGDENVKIDAMSKELVTPDSVDDHVGEGAVINGSARFDGALTVVTLDSNQQPIVFWQNEGSWEVVNLQKWLTSPQVSGQLVTYTDPKDGLTYAAAPSDQGLLLFSRSSEGQWSFSNLTTSIAGSSAIDSDLTQFIGTDGMVSIAGLLANGDLVVYTQTIQNGVSPVWSFKNISDDLRAQSLEMPRFVGEFISYVTSWNGQNIAGLDDEGNIQVVWWSPSLEQWRTDNLSSITGAAPLAGGLNAYLTGWGGINLAGADADGNVSVTWWVPDMGAEWSSSNLTEQFAGPSVERDSLASYVTPWGGLNVTGLDTAGNLVVYWWSPGLQNWQVSDLSSLINPAKKPVGTMRGVASPTGQISLLGASTDNDALRFWWQPGSTWVYENLTIEA